MGQGVAGPHAARRGAGQGAAGSGSHRAASSAATAEQGVADDTAPAAAPLVDLPTSDESESLLRIRHTVRAPPRERLTPRVASCAHPGGAAL